MASGRSFVLPPWIVAWMIIGGVVQVWDMFFLFLRPRTMEGGDLNAFWQPYNLYVIIDTKYGDMEDQFVRAQAVLNFFEVILQVIVLYLHFKRSRLTVLLTFTVTCFTFWKTCVYMLQYTPLCNGASLVAHLDWLKWMGLFIIPNGIWIIVPGFVMLHLWSKLSNVLHSSGGGKDD
ncbi:uncharacterized protein [Oscarella lobularis]|uniref:uncharacterized protein n=1 Tax=Oscarella lobularis TaxID=121494 RepID=UPI003313C6F8